MVFFGAAKTFCNIVGRGVEFLKFFATDAGYRAAAETIYAGGLRNGRSGPDSGAGGPDTKQTSSCMPDSTVGAKRWLHLCICRRL